MPHSLIRPARESSHPAEPGRGPQDEARSLPDFEDSPRDDGDEQTNGWDDCDSWPPDDLDLELDDEPEPEPGDFWMPDDGEERGF